MAECLDLLALPSWVTWIFLILLAVCTMATDNQEPLLPSAPAKGAPPVKKSQGDPDFFPGLFNGMIYTPPDKDTTTRLPEFVPDGPRPFIPDPSFMPGETEIVVHSGERAILPCMVQHLGTRQVTWTKTGIGHFLSIGTDIWAPDPNLRISHYSWPAGVSAWNMVINEVKMADAGEYQCAIIATEKMVWKVNLTVVEKPPHNPVISIEGKEFVESGQTVYLKCNTTEGDRIPDDVDWFKDGDKIESSVYPNVVITKFRSKDTMSLVSELMIISGSSNDSGTYICRSSTELIASVEVNVLVADSSNVKRGTGASHTQPGNGHNCATTFLYPKIVIDNFYRILTAFLTATLLNKLIT